MVPHMFCYSGMTSYRGIFDVLGVPYVGCSAECMALTSDKAQTRDILSANGVRVARGEVLTHGQRPEMSPPLVLKPAREDNSQGVVLVKRGEDLDAALETAFKFDSKVVCEEFIAGREVRAAILEEDDGSFTLLPMTEYFLEDIRTSAHKLKTDEQGVVDISNGVNDAIVKTE